MEVYVLEVCPDYESSQIKGVVSDERQARAWTERRVLRASGESSVQAPDIVHLPTGFRHGDTAYIYEKFEMDKVS